MVPVAAYNRINNIMRMRHRKQVLMVTEGLFFTSIPRFPFDHVERTGYEGNWKGKMTSRKTAVSQGAGCLIASATNGDALVMSL